jgi:hypothetical protein
LEELCEEICQNFENSELDYQKVCELLGELIQALSGTTRRFVDIDNSAREDLALSQAVRTSIKSCVEDIERQEDLFKIYSSLKNYLGLKYKYGEAADWYLKGEFDSHLEDVIKKLI